MAFKIKKSSFLVAALSLFFSVIFSSCIWFNISFGDNEPKNAGEYLRKNFPGNFSNERTIRVEKDSSIFDDMVCTYKAFYSSSLNKDVIVRIQNYKVNNEKRITYASNFYFLKNEDKIVEKLKKNIIDDFSDISVEYDFSNSFSMFTKDSTNDFLSYEDYEIRMAPCSVFIHLTEQEAADYEERLKSTAFRFYYLSQNYYSIWRDRIYSKEIYYHVTMPGSQNEKRYKSELENGYRLVEVVED